MQQRATSTRSAVLHAAAVVFERRGYAASTIAEILSEGEVTKGAAYFHFRSKEELAQAIVAEQTSWRNDQAPLDPGAGSVQYVVDLSYRFAEALQGDVLVRASIRLTLERNTFERHSGEADQYQAWLDDISPHFVDAYNRGELSIDPETAAYLTVSGVSGTQLVSEALTNRSDLPYRLHHFWRAIIPGILTPGTRDLIDIRPLRARGKGFPSI